MTNTEMLAWQAQVPVPQVPTWGGHYLLDWSCLATNTGWFALQGCCWKPSSQFTSRAKKTSTCSWIGRRITISLLIQMPQKWPQFQSTSKTEDEISLFIFECNMRLLHARSRVRKGGKSRIIAKEEERRVQHTKKAQKQTMQSSIFMHIFLERHFTVLVW